METLLQDLRYAVRTLRRSPGFTTVAVLTLALGIGANTTIFGVLDALFLSPPAGVRDADRVVRLYIARNEGNAQTPEGGPGSYPDYRDLRAGSRAFAGVAGQIGPMDVSFGRGESARQLKGLLVTGGYFPTLETRPALGRFFGPAEDSIPGASPVAVISHALWERQFAESPDVPGRQITLNGQAFTVIGVAPEHFNGMDSEPVDLWVPTAMMGAMGMGDWLTNRNFVGLQLFGRLAPGMTPERAAADAGAVMRHAAEGTESLDPTPEVRPGPVNASLGPQRSEAADVVLWLGLVTGVVLLIACANVANLLLARAARRRREIAVRISLGVSRWRLVQQLLTESVLLALLGGAGGLLLTLWGADLVRLFPLPSVPSVIDGRMLAFTAALSLLTGVLFGLVPALQASRVDLVSALRDGAPAEGRGRSRLRSGLLVGQVALSLVLLIGAGLLVRSLGRMQAVDVGMDAEGLLLVSVDLEQAGYDAAGQAAFYDRMLERLGSLPGVQRTSNAQFAPFGGSLAISFQIPGRDSLPPVEEGPYVNFVGPDHFATVGTPVRLGRPLTGDDRAGSARVAVVNETMAEIYWPGESAVGKCIKIGGTGGSGPPPCTEIVGVVGNSKYHSLQEEPIPGYYLPLLQNADLDVPSVFSGRTVFVRTRGEPGAMIGTVRRAVQGLAPDLPFVQVQTLSEVLRPQLLPFRLGATLFSLFGGLALLLAAIGLYGVVAFTVAQQTREIGVRIALGAGRGDVLRLVISRALALTLVGVAVGVAGAAGVTRFMESLLYGVSAVDPATFILVPLLLIAVALLAAYLPARRATRVDPMIALRHE